MPLISHSSPTASPTTAPKTITSSFSFGKSKSSPGPTPITTQQFIKVDKDASALLKSANSSSSYLGALSASLKRPFATSPTSSSLTPRTPAAATTRPASYAQMLKSNVTTAGPLYTSANAPMKKVSADPFPSASTKKNGKKSKKMKLQHEPPAGNDDDEQRRLKARESRFKDAAADREAKLYTQSILNKRAKVRTHTYTPRTRS